jgi:uncharacterized protein YtpQ (UPF0354 family)
VGGAVLPLLVASEDERGIRDLVREDFLPGLVVAYSFGPPYGNRLVRGADLNRLGVTVRDLRRLAAGNLNAELDRVGIHGQSPTRMLSFDGLESSVLLDVEFWEEQRGTVPGELVVGVPARDVVIITGTESRQGMEKVRRAVDRVFFAGGEHLLSRDLLVWRRRAWEVLRPALAGPGRRQPIDPLL